jgi:ferric-dicitrate binding protein FerR (iron transport regulator)
MSSTSQDDDHGSVRRPKPLIWHGAVLVASALALLEGSTGQHPASRVRVEGSTPETTYVVAFGQRRSIDVAGLRVAANSETTLHAKPSEKAVHLMLSRGEVVAESPASGGIPFVIDARNLRITSTSADSAVWVRQHGDELITVGLHAGTAELESLAWGMTQLRMHLREGQLAIYRENALPRIEEFPALEFARRTAWRDGDVWLTGQTLREAVAEFNRYNTRKLVILDEQTAAFRVGGRFYANNPRQFAQALETLGVRTSMVGSDRKGHERILLYGAPTNPRTHRRHSPPERPSQTHAVVRWLAGCSPTRQQNAQKRCALVSSRPTGCLRSCAPDE